MTQKEILYIEDIYNHSNILVKLLTEYQEELECGEYSDVVKSSIKGHSNQMKKAEKLLSGESDE